MKSNYIIIFFLLIFAACQNDKSINFPLYNINFGSKKSRIISTDCGDTLFKIKSKSNIEFSIHGSSNEYIIYPVKINYFRSHIGHLNCLSNSDNQINGLIQYLTNGYNFATGIEICKIQIMNEYFNNNGYTFIQNSTNFLEKYSKLKSESIKIESPYTEIIKKKYGSHIFAYEDRNVKFNDSVKNILLIEFDDVINNSSVGNNSKNKKLNKIIDYKLFYLTMSVDYW